MRMPTRSILCFLLVVLLPAVFPAVHAQSNSGTVTGTVTDPTGAVIPGATVAIQNPVSGLQRTATTDSAGRFQFINLPHNTYHVTAPPTGFRSFASEAAASSPIS